MTRIMIFVMLSCMMTFAQAQKRPLNFSDLDNWPYIGGDISPNGKYVSYSVIYGGKSDLYIKALNTSSEKKYAGVTNSQFTTDGRSALIMMAGDSLCILTLDGFKEHFLSGISSFQIPQNIDSHCIACQSTTGELFLYDLDEEKQITYGHIDRYQFSDNGSTLLLVNKDTLSLLDLPGRKIALVWNGKGADNFTFDLNSEKLAFTTGDSIWFYKKGMSGARLLITDHTSGVDSGLDVNGNAMHFSPNGDKLFFDVSHKPYAKQPDPKAASVDVWSYKDKVVQSQQLADLPGQAGQTYRLVTLLTENKVIRLEQDQDEGFGKGELNTGMNDNYLLAITKFNNYESYRSVTERPDVFLINTETGERKLIIKRFYGEQPRFSPGGHYVYWFDKAKMGWYSYNIQTGKLTDISSKVKTEFSTHFNGQAGFAPHGVAGWIKNDKYILIYDEYDTWKLDPNGITAPDNLTKGYGRRNHISLRFTYDKGFGSDFSAAPLAADSTIVLCGFDQLTKQNDFFRQRLDKASNPLLLSKNSAYIYFSDMGVGDFQPNFPIEKAHHTNMFLLKRATATGYPNLVVTKDFCDFKQVSDLHPQDSVNWLTSELVQWKTFDGSSDQAILYKPENFDPHKKYPVIFYMYELLTGSLYDFPTPEYSYGSINIPWFVSHGYLVCCVDIHYQTGHTGSNVYNDLVSCAKKIAAYSWVDSKRMGIQGHSWGGFEVNYLVTHTNLFAAASSAAGPTDWISNYGSLAFFKTLNNDWYDETGQPRLGEPFWKAKDRYIANSPVFNVADVTTPLLMMHNKNDTAVPWAQGVEFFLDLRRAGKKVWMLQYDHGTHGVTADEDKLDYFIRLQQFFDHYLKDKPAPKWMVEGIPASMKQIDKGYELEPGKIP